MKKTVILLILSLFICQAAYAHSPSDINISYSQSTKMLKAVISHDVADPNNHYVREVIVGLNGKYIVEQFLSGQDNKTTQTVSYLIPDAKIGDTFYVEAYCSISGKLRKEIKISR